MEQSRCQSHTSHVAVVDLPPLSPSPSIHPSIPCFSPLCQDVSSVSLRGVSPSHKPAFPPPPPPPPPPTLLLSPKHLPRHCLIMTICGLLLPRIYVILNHSIHFMKNASAQEQLPWKWSPLCFPIKGHDDTAPLLHKSDLFLKIEAFFSLIYQQSHLRCRTLPKQRWHVNSTGPVRMLISFLFILLKKSKVHARLLKWIVFISAVAS